MSQFLKWAAEMDRAASAVELASDGSTECLAIIDGNRAIAEVLRHGAVIEAKLEALESSLAEMAVKLDEGIECYPSSPCNIFATLLELHGLWRGKPSAKVQP
jgi:hypothetical protein